MSLVEFFDIKHLCCQVIKTTKPNDKIKKNGMYKYKDECSFKYSKAYYKNIPWSLSSFLYKHVINTTTIPKIKHKTPTVIFNPITPFQNLYQKLIYLSGTKNRIKPIPNNIATAKKKFNFTDTRENDTTKINQSIPTPKDIKLK